MMRFELGPEKPNPKRAFVGAAAIAGHSAVTGSGRNRRPTAVLAAVAVSSLLSIRFDLVFGEFVGKVAAR